MKKITIAIFVLLAFAACHKGKFDCRYSIKPLIKISDSAKDALFNTSVVGYAIYGDTTQWYISSWDDAQAGVFTNLSGETKPYEFKVEAAEGDSILRFDFIRDAMLVVCDTEHRIYGYRNAPVVEDLSAISISIRFEPAKKSARYDDMRWKMINQFWEEYVPPAPVPVPEPEPEEPAAPEEP